MGRAMFFVAILVVFAYFVFFKNFTSHMGITPQTKQQLEDRAQNDRSDTDNNSNTNSNADSNTNTNSNTDNNVNTDNK